MKKILLICCLFVGFIAAGYGQTTGTDPLGKAKALQKELNLTDDQTAKVSVIYQESAKKFDKIKAHDDANTDKMLVDIGPLRKSTVKKIKAVLTPSQGIKYDELLKDKNDSALNGGWSGGWTYAAI